MLKVLFVTSELHGGSAFYVSTLLQAFLKAGIEASIAFRPNQRPLEIPVTALLTGAPVLLRPFKSAGGLLVNGWKLWREIRTGRYDAVYTNTVFPAISVAILKFLGLIPKTTVAIHTLHSLFSDRARGIITLTLSRALERMMGSLFDSVIAPSSYMLAASAGLYETQKVQLIRNALDATLEHKLNEIAALRYARPAKPYTEFLFVGRCDRQKGLDTLIMAFDELLAHAPCKLVLAGVTEEELDALNLALKEPTRSNIRALGWVQDTSSLYLTADVFVMPSRWEAFGLTLLEARLAGMYCIGTKVDAIPELILDGAGLLVEKDDVIGLSRAMHQAMAEARVLQPTFSSLPRSDAFISAHLDLLAKIAGPREERLRNSTLDRRKIHGVAGPDHPVF